MRTIILVVAATVLLAACKGKGKKEEAEAPKVYTFKPVSIPMTYSDPADQAQYLAKHFWDNFDFTDTAYIHLPEVTEQAFANYLQVLFRTPFQTASSSVKAMLKQAEKKRAVFDYFTDMYDKYLYDPNSPMRNEELYVAVLEALLESPLLDEDEKVRPNYRLEKAMKNRVGTVAADVEFTLASGKISRLHAVKADYVLLFINNPDCPACKEYREQIVASFVATTLIAEGRLKVVALYPDEDVAAWKAYAPQMPENWINGYDHILSMKKQELYDLRAIPTLYLLDGEKKVLLKDAYFQQIEYYLATATQ